MKFDTAYSLSLDDKLSIYDVRDLNFDETADFDLFLTEVSAVIPVFEVTFACAAALPKACFSPARYLPGDASAVLSTLPF